MAKSKFYVVWKERKTGIFENWDDCNRQVHRFTGAKFKSFSTKQLAEEAFKKPSENFISTNIYESELPVERKSLIGKPILKSISVDGAWNTTTGDVEYQGVDTKTKKVLFKMGPLPDGTNNIVEFLGIFHGLVYCKIKKLTLPIYSDSTTAIAWIVRKEARTQHPRRETNEKLFKLIDRAIIWLNKNEYSNKILKWETKAWGENPADFGRK